LKLLAQQSKSFSGAEIEQVVYDAMQSSFSVDEEFTMNNLLKAIADCVPLVQIAQTQIQDLKTWAIRSGAKSASVQETYIPNTRSIFLEIDPLGEN
jgi:hypothetical protein